MFSRSLQFHPRAFHASAANTSRLVTRHGLALQGLSEARSQVQKVSPDVEKRLANRLSALGSRARPSRLAGLKNRMLWAGLLLCLLSFQGSQLMARNDGLAMGWVPPIEPPGVVIVTANSLQPQPSAASERLTDQDPVAGLKGENEALRSALEQWSHAWRQQDMGLYLAAYAGDFEPANGMDRPAWAKWRTARILGKQHIRHDMQDVTVQMDGGKALVQFTQVYRDERAELTDHKTMHWAKREGRWLITREMID